MPRITVATVVKLLVASLIVGAVMAWLQIRPNDLLNWVTGSFEQLAQITFANLNAAVGYVLLGAVIVIPLWLLSLLLRYFGRR